MQEPVLKESVNLRAFLPIVSVASALALLLGMVSTFLFLPCAAVAFALLFRYSPKGRGVLLSLLISAACAVIYAVISAPFVPYILFAILGGWLLSHSLRVGRPKFDTAIYMMGIYLFVMLVSLWLSAVQATANPAPGAAIDYYIALVSDFKEELLLGVDASELGAEYAESYLALMTDVVDTIFDSIYALAAVEAFLAVGIAMKLFSALVQTLDAQGTDAVRRFRFAPPLLFAYFHFALFLANLFTAAGDSVPALTINNLYLVFTVVFAYVGIKYLFFILSRTRHPRRNRVLLLLAIVIFFTWSIQFLALEGAVAVITANRLHKHRGHSDES